MSPVLSVEGLQVDLPLTDGTLHPVRGIDFEINAGETLCIVGESGCGKSMTSLAIMGLLPRRALRRAGRLEFAGEDLRGATDRRMARIRGNQLGMIFQEPMTSLNPSYTIGNQLEEAMLVHRPVARREARDRAVFLLEKVGIPAAGRRLGQYPHQLSGGLRQRVMIAMTLMCGPKLIIADEPTTALDVTIQAQILRLLRDLQAEFNMALMLITHDLGVVARVADRVAVMYAGQFVEYATAAELFAAPLHPYTQGLLRCIPVPGRVRAGDHLGSIPGMVPNMIGEQRGCSFANRCDHAFAACGAGAVPLLSLDSRRGFRCLLPTQQAMRNAGTVSSGVGSLDPAARRIVPAASAAPAPVPVLEARDVHRSYLVRQGVFQAPLTLHAVKGVSLTLNKGDVLALVGESGCGKSTLAKLLLGLETPTSGDILFDGRSTRGQDRVAVARRIQPVFQDPYSSLNPRKTIASIVELPLLVHGIGTATERRRRCTEMLDRVGLPKRVLDNHPNQLSGGQRQRVAIARALIMHPEVVICDEPTSSLDGSVQAQILNLLTDLRKELGLTYLLISHDLSVVEHMATRVAVMYLGRIVEERATAALTRSPMHPYTRTLLASALTPEPGRGLPAAHGDATAFPNPLNVPPGCSFHPRCPEAMAICREISPLPMTAAGTGLIECHLHDCASRPAAVGAQGT